MAGLAFASLLASAGAQQPTRLAATSPAAPDEAPVSLIAAPAPPLPRPALALCIPERDRHAIIDGRLDISPRPPVLPAGCLGAIASRIRPDETLCRAVESAAGRHGLPPIFLLRVIFKESRFDANAVSPKGAEGIAQFMPGTAAMRGLRDSFDPAQAIPHAAWFLADLKAQFGSLGLAAAAYNSGPGRVARWLAAEDGLLPAETEDYVAWITGEYVSDWRTGKATWNEAALTDGNPYDAHCQALLRGRATGGKGVAGRAPGAPKSPPAPWGVQVAAHFDRAKAMSLFGALKRSNAGTVTGTPIVVRVTNRSRGSRPLHAIRLGARSREEALAKCTALRSAGVACTVLKN